ncbi:major facilitator superfamily domain-containing protein [Penicillium frequentans]|uniref:Major facilitator superfamily domain-containing protein n=1 Tax=Penicillium frequentans TaxID=3151616 RepID=A0AAD6GDU6_9EURO|nr:major facilitator superfamily domain-containing protein [Penicillium glabrum]
MVEISRGRQSVMERGEHTISDVEVMGEKAEMSHEETLHLAELTPQEKVLEKSCVGALIF